jgi:hypothetical protein
MKRRYTDRVSMRRFPTSAAVAVVGLLVPAVAHAHFILQGPQSWAEQGSLGDPQKTAPCGPGPGEAVTETGEATSFAPGGMVTVTINETVTHPGHYRVALSTTGQAGLPADPPVTPVGTDQCGMKEIMNPPVFPVLADGMLPHTSAFSGPQSFSVQLPAGMTCTSNCVLQVTEYMQNHGAPCLYHHCANITIQAGAVSDGGLLDAGGLPHLPSDPGCGCGVVGARASGWGALLLLVACVARRRRR